MSAAAPSFVFVLHHHQPVGNLESVLERAYERCYRPVLEHLERHARVRAGLHYSGPLIEWLARAHRPFLDRVKALVGRGQVEILGGGFYEPILATIPENDALGQIEMMQQAVERFFGARPQGLWLAERVFDGDLPRLLASTGLGYTLIDDHLLEASGVEGGGHFLTEKAGHPLALLSIEQGLRHRIPFAGPEDVVRSLVESRAGVARIYADDAEKLGLWPGTEASVEPGGWLERFFVGLEGAVAEEKLSLLRPADLLSTVPPRARVYPAEGAYPELMRWALPSAVSERLRALEERLSRAGLLGELRPFLGGGRFGDFYAKYSEAGQLHAKMIDVSSRLAEAMDDAIQASGSERIGGGLGDLLGTAQRELYRGQCCCAYWHGLFGGLYLGHLRHALYAALLEAEWILDGIQQGSGDWISHEQRDLNADGRDEVLLSNRILNAYFSPHLGGALYELDHKPRRFMATDVLTRRLEPYHRLIEGGAISLPPGVHQHADELLRVKEANLKALLVYDDRPRASFVDRILPLELTLDLLRASGAGDEGDFASGAYRVASLAVDEAKGSSAELVMARDGRAGPSEGSRLAIEKRFVLPIDSGDLSVRYRLSNPGEQALQFVFGCELNLSLLASDHPTRSLRINGAEERFAPGSAGVTESFREALLVDEEAKIRIALDVSGEARLFRYPIETVSRSEDGLERGYQGTCFMPTWKVELSPGAARELSLSLSLSEVGT